MWKWKLKKPEPYPEEPPRKRFRPLAANLGDIQAPSTPSWCHFPQSKTLLVRSASLPSVLQALPTNQVPTRLVKTKEKATQTGGSNVRFKGASRMDDRPECIFQAGEIQEKRRQRRLGLLRPIDDDDESDWGQDDDFHYWTSDSEKFKTDSEESDPMEDDDDPNPFPEVYSGPESLDGYSDREDARPGRDKVPFHMTYCGKSNRRYSPYKPHIRCVWAKWGRNYDKKCCDVCKKQYKIWTKMTWVGKI